MSQKQSYWRSFPAVEKLYTEGRLPDFLSQCERSCQALDDIVKGGDSREKDRAQAAMTAYGHTLQLLDKLAADAAAAEAAGH